MFCFHQKRSLLSCPLLLLRRRSLYLLKMQNNAVFLPFNSSLRIGVFIPTTNSASSKAAAVILRSWLCLSPTFTIYYSTRELCKIGCCYIPSPQYSYRVISHSRGFKWYLLRSSRTPEGTHFRRPHAKCRLETIIDLDCHRAHDWHCQFTRCHSPATGTWIDISYTDG